MAAKAVLIKLSVLAVLVAVAWRVIYSSRRLPPVTEGFFLPQYRPVAELFRKYVEDGTEQGGSFAVYHLGEPLVDLWGGYADPDSRRPWRSDTVTMVWSCSKGASALAVAKLLERGQMDYKAEVHQYWPEFAQNGKANITVEMLLSHQAGLVTLGGKSVSLLEYKHDWQKMERLMAAASPDFPPGSQVAYQAFTYGMYVDALIRRVDPQHRNLSQFFDQEIAQPYGISFYIGLPLQQYHRAARQFFVSPWKWLLLFLDPAHRPFLWTMLTSPSDTLFMRAYKVLDFFGSQAEILNDPHQMEVGLGSLMGFSAASSLAKMYSILANGGSVGGRALLPKSLVDTFSVAVTRSLPMENPKLHFSKGFQVTKNVLGDEVFGHDGNGGQQAKADPKNRLGVSYTTNFHWANRFTPPDHYLELERVFYDCFQRHQAEKAR